MYGAKRCTEDANVCRKAGVVGERLDRDEAESEDSVERSGVRMLE